VLSAARGPARDRLGKEKPVSQISRVNKRLLHGYSVQLTTITALGGNYLSLFEGVGGEDERSSLPLSRF